MQRNAEPISITRRGRPGVYVVSKQEYDELTKLLAINQSQVDIEKAKAAVAAFRGKGKGGAVERLLDDRRTDRNRKNERLLGGYVCFACFAR